MASLLLTWSLSRTANVLTKRNFRACCKKISKPSFTSVAKQNALKVSVTRPVVISMWKTVRRTYSHYENYTDLKYDDFVALLEGGDVQLIDVRDEKDIQEQGAFPNAGHIPLCELKVALGMDEKEFADKYGIKKPTSEDTNLVFVSFSSVKSSAALEIAHKNGYKNARQYSNGFEEWKLKQEEEARRVGTS